MTAAEYRAQVASGKIKPVSAQKRKATARKKLDKAAKPERINHAGYTDLVEIRVQVPGGVEVIHWVNPELTELIAKIKAL